MDGLPQNQPEEPKKNVLLQELEFGLGGILLGVGTFLLMLFVLNYFNIVSLSQVFPKYFAFLPHRSPPKGVPSGTPQSQLRREAPTGTSPTPIQSGPTPTPTKLTLSCPVPKEFCNQAKSIKSDSPELNQQESYLGWTLPKDSPIQAVFDGTIATQDSNINASASSRLVTLLSTDGRYEAKYLFMLGDSPNSQKNNYSIKKGEIIETIPGITFIMFGYNDINLRFSAAYRGGKTLELKPEDLGNLTLP